MDFFLDLLEKLWKVVRVILILVGVFFIWAICTMIEKHFIIKCLYLLLLGGVPIGIVVAIEILKRGYADRCPNCRKWFALKKVRTEFVKEEKISVKVETNSYNLDREVIGYNEQYIPGIKEVYRIHFRCKKCGEKCSSVVSERKASR